MNIIHLPNPIVRGRYMVPPTFRSGLTIAYRVQSRPEGDVVELAVSFCHPDDKYDESIGERNSLVLLNFDHLRDRSSADVQTLPFSDIFCAFVGKTAENLPFPVPAYSVFRPKAAESMIEQYVVLNIKRFRRAVNKPSRMRRILSNSLKASYESVTSVLAREIQQSQTQQTSA